MTIKRANTDRIAGIVLAGGKSSRMGSSKALLDYKGAPLLEHMMNVLHAAGCGDVHISGDVAGYPCIADAVRHDGPARAMADLLRRFGNNHERLLFVPVDMPLLPAAALRHLANQDGGAFYSEHPLPACLRTDIIPAPCDSVRELLLHARARVIPLPPEWKGGMANVNTKAEWDFLVRRK